MSVKTIIFKSNEETLDKNINAFMSDSGNELLNVVLLSSKQLTDFKHNKTIEYNQHTVLLIVKEILKEV